MDTRKCFTCKIIKDINDFYCSKNRHAYRCKICTLKIQKDNYSKKKNGIVKSIEKTADILLRGSRICHTCKNELDLSSFRKVKYKNGGFAFDSSCISCNNKSCREYGTNNRKKRNERLRKYRKNNPEKMKIHDRKRSLKYNYNLSIDEYNDMVLKQNGQCYICKIEKKLVVDHNHKTGKVRKLLCQGCNTVLGRIEMIEDGVAKFGLYLENHC